MGFFLVSVSQIVDTVFVVLTRIFNLVTTNAVLVAFFALWVVRRIFKLFHLL